MVKYPDQISTTERDEMVCPECFTEGLEPNPGFVDEYDGRGEILNATRCPNEDCSNHYGLEPEEVDMQLAAPSFREYLSIDKIDVETALTAIVVLAGLGFLIFGVFGGAFSTDPNNEPPEEPPTPVDPEENNTTNGPIGGGTVDIQGKVSTEQRDVSITVQNENGEAAPVQVQSNGRFVLQNITQGTYTLGLKPSRREIAVPQNPTISVTEDGYSIVGSTAVSKSEEQLVIPVRDTSTFETSRIISSGSTQFEVTNPSNYDSGLKVELRPITQETVPGNAAVESENRKTIFIPSEVVEQSATVQTLARESQEVFNKQYGGRPQTISLPKNTDQVLFELSTEAGISQQQQSGRVSGSGSIPFQIESTSGPTKVILQGKSEQTIRSQTGTWAGTDPTITIQEDSAPSTVTVTASGNIKRENQRLTGTVQDGVIQETIGGTLDATNAEISFTGGQQTEEETAWSESVQASGESGTEVASTSSFTAPRTGEYALTWDYTVSRNQELVSASYTVNGQETRIEQSSSTTLSLSEGETVELSITAEQEGSDSSEEKSYEGDDSPVLIQDTIVQPKQASAGETVALFVELKNPTDSRASKPITAFVDGESIGSISYSLAAGETRTVEVTRTSFSSEETHTLSVNDQPPETVQVGDGELAYGRGQISGEITPQTDGQLRVDTTGDGDFDCTVAPTGTCSIGTLTPGDTSINVEETSITGTEYSLSYTQREGPSDVRVDIDRDGTPEIESDGVLGDGDTLSGNAEVEAGKQSIDFESRTGGEVKYNTSWQRSSSVQNLDLLIDGREIASGLSFTGTKEIETEVSEGAHVLELRSDGQNEITADIRWETTQDYPPLSIDGNEVCQPSDFSQDQQCTVQSEELQQSEVTIDFSSDKSFEYTLQYVEVISPEQVSFVVNGQDVRVTRSQAEDIDSSGRWETTIPVDALQSGSNQISVQTDRGRAVVEFEYSFENIRPLQPSVRLINDESSRNIQIPDSNLDGNGYLLSSAQLTVPQEQLTEGTNEIQFSLENNGIYNASVTGTDWDDQEVTIKPD